MSARARDRDDVSSRRHVSLRAGKSLADRVLRPVAARQLPDPRDLLEHCAQEMNHLAGFLPELFARFGEQ